MTPSSRTTALKQHSPFLSLTHQVMMLLVCELLQCVPICCCQLMLVALHEAQQPLVPHHRHHAIITTKRQEVSRQRINNLWHKHKHSYSSAEASIMLAGDLALVRKCWTQERQQPSKPTHLQHTTSYSTLPCRVMHTFCPAALV